MLSRLRDPTYLLLSECPHHILCHLPFEYYQVSPPSRSVAGGSVMGGRPGSSSSSISERSPGEPDLPVTATGGAWGMGA